MEKSAFGLVLVALVVGACSSTTYVNNFVVDADASTSGDDASVDGQAADSSDGGDTDPVDASGPSTDADADAVTDGGTDASTCALDTTPTVTSDDCYPEASCDLCGNVGFSYRCGQSQSVRPANTECTTPSNGSACCRPACVRRTSNDATSCPDYPATSAWACPYDSSLGVDTWPKINRCSPTVPGIGKVAIVYCCDATAVPEWPLY